MSSPKRPKPVTPATIETSPAPKRPQDWTALERAQAVLSARQLDNGQVGEFLRRQGLHQEQLDAWTNALEDALAHPPTVRRPSGDVKRIKELERELARKDKALAEAAALLVLKKKMAQLWGDEDDDTDPRNDK